MDDHFSRFFQDSLEAIDQLKQVVAFKTFEKLYRFQEVLFAPSLLHALLDNKDFENVSRETKKLAFIFGNASCRPLAVIDKRKFAKSAALL